MAVTRLSVSGVWSLCSQRLMAPCSQTVQTLSGIRRGAPAGTLHPPRQGRHRGFMSTVPCMDLRIFQNASPSPRPPVRLKPEPHLPPLSPAGSTLPGTFFFFFNFSPPSSRDLHGPAWPGLEMHLHFHIRIGTGSSWAKVKVWLNQMPLCHSNRAFRRVQGIFTLK